MPSGIELSILEKNMDLDDLLTESLLAGASEAFDRIADELIALHDVWLAVEAEAIHWVRGLISDAGWWSGRLAAGSSTRQA